VRAKSGIVIACISAFSLLLCAGARLRAQAPEASSQPAGVSSEESTNDLSVAVGKTVLVDCAWPIKRIANNLGEVADVHPTSPTEIMIQGKTPGETSLIVWDTHGGRQFFNVSVRASTSILNDKLDGVRRELRAELPGQPLKVTYDNGMIFLRGTVKNLESSTRAARIASTAGKVVNLLDVEVPPSEPQILLKVRFLSVDREKEKQLGINIYSTGLGNTTGTISTGQFSAPTVTSSGSTTTTTATDLNLNAYYPGLNIGATIEAL
jgi:pilus assembly protein CpaC